MSAIKAVCFDLDGVYFTPESFQHFKKAISGNVDEDVVNQILYKSPEMLNFKKGLITEDEYWNFVRKSLNISLSNDEISKILRDSYEVNGDIVEIVKMVKAKGFKTCICSNNFDTRIRELNKKFDFLKDFDVQIFSFQVGVMKPDKGIFEALINSSEVLPNEILYSDDSPEKLQGAIDLGINTFVFENVEQFIGKLKEFSVL